MAACPLVPDRSRRALPVRDAVNKAPWRFGDLFAVYVVIFFVIAQIQAFLLFGERPSPALIIGGALIAAGGMVITIWR